MMMSGMIYSEYLLDCIVSEYVLPCGVGSGLAPARCVSAAWCSYQ